MTQIKCPLCGSLTSVAEIEERLSKHWTEVVADLPKIKTAFFNLRSVVNDIWTKVREPVKAEEPKE